MTPQQISLLESWKNDTVVLYLFWREDLILGKDKSEFAFHLCFPSSVIGNILEASWEMQEQLNCWVFYNTVCVFELT